jgi:hypothetical protein
MGCKGRCNPISFPRPRLAAAILRLLGIIASGNGTMRLDVSFSTRPADINLRIGEIGSAVVGKKRSTYPRKSRRCSPVDFRLGVVLTRIANGAEEYRASATERHCDGDAATALPVLASAVLADIGKPKGDYVIERKITK